MGADASGEAGMSHRTATDIAADVRQGRRTAVNETRDCLTRIAVHDDALGAFQVVRSRRAIYEAAAVDARPDLSELPLAGVPIAIKDNVAVAGEPRRDGSAATSAEPQSLDHPVVQRVRAAGAVVVGITRVPELCVFGATDSVYGITRNPWNLDRTPGGSSGGSAAAVAAGLVPIAHGNDGMGSIRIPAACTGLVGIKPGRGVVPGLLAPPGLPESAAGWYRLSENGALATTVADAALLLSVLADRPDLSVVGLPDGSLRVALSTMPPVAGIAVDQAFAGAAADVAGALAAAGHSVEAADPITRTGWAGNAAALAGLARWFVGVDDDARDTQNPSALEPRVRTHARIGRIVRRTPLMTERMRNTWIRHATAFLSDYDVLVTPGLAQPPIEARAWGQGGWWATVMANARFAPYAAPWNVAGFPALVLPMGVHPTSGTPLSIQLVAAPGRESLLLGVAALIEDARPWQRVAPAYA